MSESAAHVMWFGALGQGDVAKVGGKNASLGEMARALSARGIKTPPGFATTTDAYWAFVEANGLSGLIAAALDELAESRAELQDVGSRIRAAFHDGRWPDETADAIKRAYRELSRRLGRTAVDVAVRSSATAEDSPSASFAGQLETYLNIRGEEALLDACKRCQASLFTDRAISYRIAQRLDRTKVALSVGVQLMVRSDLASSGVIFSIDTETGFDKVVVINAAWGLGENVVQGAVDPDEYRVFKPLLVNPSLQPIVEKKRGDKEMKLVYGDTPSEPTRNIPTSVTERTAFALEDREILALSRWACLIEDHYVRPMDIEWAKDGQSGELYIVQARPETVQSRRRSDALVTYRVLSKGSVLAKGLSIGQAVALSLLLAALSRRLRARMQGAQAPARDVRVHQCRGHDSFLPFARGGRSRARRHGR